MKLPYGLYLLLAIPVLWLVLWLSLLVIGVFALVEQFKSTKVSEEDL